MEKLIRVITKLKVGKTNVNAFGKYKYRTCSDIFEEVKPLLAEEGLLLNVSDTVEYIEGRWYVKATATVYDAAQNSIITSSFGYAREEESKAGMAGGQITGASSSYARKYAL
jgi:hypothetical protein